VRGGFVAARVGPTLLVGSKTDGALQCAASKARLNYALDLARLGCVQGGAQEHLDCSGHGGEAVVFGEALVVAVINLLDDYG
jgi:hypothetical protein